MNAHRAPAVTGLDWTGAARGCSTRVVELPSILAVAAVALGLGGLLHAEARGWRRARAACKVGASLGFVTLGALSAQDRFGWLVLAGLCLSAVGDALLLSSAARTFLAGMGAFLLAHVAYAVAFAPAARLSGPALGIVVIAGAGVLAWLWRHLGAMRLPVLAYSTAISAMLLVGLGHPNRLVPWGALLFYLSDLCVARDRFVRPGLANRVVGLPLYYAAQVVLAVSARG